MDVMLNFIKINYGMLELHIIRLIFAVQTERKISSCTITVMQQ